MQSLALNLAVGSCASALAFRVVFCINLYDIAVFIFLAEVLLKTLDDVGILQAHFLARSKTLEFLLGNLLKIVALNP